MRRSWITAAVALVAAFVLIGGSATLARWVVTKPGTAVVITTGTLVGRATGPTIAYPATVAATPAGVVVRPGSAGIVPGLVTETLTWTVFNDGSPGLPAKVSMSIASAITDSTRYTAVQGSLAATVSIGGAPATALTVGTTGIGGTIPQSTVVVQPGASTTIVVTLSIPATSSGGADLLRGLQSQRSTALTAASFITLTPTFTLTQVPKAS